jgi:two-component system LytT family response regulator
MAFSFWKRSRNVRFDLIFTTSYDQYAIKAIRFSALDYLLKPIDREELQVAVQKAVQHRQSSLTAQLEYSFKRSITRPPASTKWRCLP